MTIFYLPLEPYKERYTEQSLSWTETRMARRGVEYQTILGETLGEKSIETGVVLDAHGRSHWTLTQTARLVSLLREGVIGPLDVLYIPDMFHPGFSALPYILDQQFGDLRPRIYVQCHAQTVDVYDFTYPMMDWMRPYEGMVDAYVSGIFVASSIHRELLRVAGFKAPIHLVGLPFDREEVRERAGADRATISVKDRVLFSSRWDQEKQPHFYMDLIERAQGDPVLREYEFAVSTSADRLRSNDPTAVSRARSMEERGLLAIYDGLSKRDYYELLLSSRVHFNCALQDFVSYTLLEASALGVPSVVPAFRSFPEALNYDHRYLYTPWSIEDALETIKQVADLGEASPYPADQSHRCLDRVLDVMLMGGRANG